jgi:hypothetical protein
MLEPFIGNPLPIAAICAGNAIINSLQMHDIPFGACKRASIGFSDASLLLK